MAQGEVSFGKDTKGKRKVVITPFDQGGNAQTDQSREYLIAKGKHIQVQKPISTRITKATTSPSKAVSPLSM